MTITLTIEELRRHEAVLVEWASNRQAKFQKLTQRIEDSRNTHDLSQIDFTSKDADREMAAWLKEHPKPELIK